MTKRNTIRYCGEDLPVLDTITVRKRQYSVLRKVGREGRRYLVHDRGVRDFRQILALPRADTSRQHIDILQRISQRNSNLPTILDFQSRDDEVHIVTTWVRGQDVKDYLRAVKDGDERWPSPTEVMKLCRGLAHGLRQMHRHRNIVHGDITPANLVLTRGPNLLVMIDFGSAWAAERSLRRSVGDGVTRHYAAPEQLIGSPVDFRCDQFSANVVAYQMITGRLPYADMGGLAGTPENRSAYESRYKPPSELCPLRAKVPKRIWRLIDEIVGRGLALDARDRFPSDDLWIDALEDLYCETRRRVRFHAWDKRLIRLFEWIGRRNTARE